MPGDKDCINLQLRYDISLAQDTCPTRVDGSGSVKVHEVVQNCCNEVEDRQCDAVAGC